MRKIKFRAKCKFLGRWMYGSLYIKRNGNVLVNSTEVHEETVGQYTGLKDKNGVEIYEGDILRFEDYPPAKVIWYDGSFNARRLDINDDYLLADWYEGTVIIGNIHDNPELLEVE